MPWLVQDEREVYLGNAVEALVDEQAWPRIYDLVREARRDIVLSQLLFEPGFDPGHGRLANALEDATERGVRVRILVNENAAVPDSYDELRARFADTRVDVRAIAMTPNVMHAKLLVADAEVAILLDSPFEQKYADSHAHEHACRDRDGGQPFHAVSLRLRGPCVQPIQDVFESLWASAAGAPPQPLPRRPTDAPAAGSQALRLAATSPAGILHDAPQGQVLAAYLRALEEAQELVYIETQYFTNATIARAIDAALTRNPRLEVILVVNTHMDVPGYDLWQTRRMAELGVPTRERLGVFALASPRRVDSAPALRDVYVHSKVALVDDVWATLGSANLDSISLEDAPEFGVVVPRNVELNAVLIDGVDGAPSTGFVAMLRRRLWAEHLGDAGVWRAERPADGWLPHWQRVAQENLRRAQEGDWRITGRVFPWDALVNGRREPLSGRPRPVR